MMLNLLFRGGRRGSYATFFAILLGLGSAFAKSTLPDGYGFFAADRTEADGPSYQFIFINGTGQKVAGPGDDISSASPVTEGGIGSEVQLAQPFFYYGEEYYTLTPSSNGYISTDPTDLGDDFSNDASLPTAPDTGGGARLYPLHDDLVISPSGGIYYAYFASGTHPHAAVGGAYHVFQWDNVYHFGGDPARIFDFEVLLFENGDILYQYGLSVDPKADSATIGIQNAAADIGNLYAANDPSALPPIPSGGTLYPSFAILFHAPRQVTNLTDTVPPPFGSLRWAFDTAPVGGTVRFAPSLAGGGTISLADQFLLAEKAITITGEDSAGGITLQAAPGRRLFEVDAGSDLNLRDLSLAGGRATGASYPANSGGAILCRGSVSLNGAVITDCHAEGDGGAVCNIAASDWLQIGKSSISDCSAGGRGGAVYSERPIAIHTVSVASCQSGQAGGGIFQTSPVGPFGPQNQIVNSVIRDCRASTFGGGLFLNYGEVVVSETDVTGCVAGQSGGGIYVPGSENHDVAFLKGSISRCTAEAGQGGGIFNGGATSSLFAASLFENTAATDGGGIFNINDAAIRYSSIYDNMAQRGGGVFNAGSSSIEIANSTIAENSSSNEGGGVYNATTGTLRLISATVAFNEGRSRGGGIYSVGGLFMAASLAAENRAGSAAPDLFGFIGTRDGVNLIGDSSGASGLNASDLRDVDAELGPLSDYGGGGIYGHQPRLFTVPLLAGSPAIDACPDLTALSLSTDQRGFPRLTNGDGQASATEMDIGAWEGLAPIVVNTLEDQRDPPGSGGPTSLREAIRDTPAPGTRILFDPAVFNTSDIPTITLTGGPLPMIGRFWLIDATGVPTGVRLSAGGSEYAIQSTGDQSTGTVVSLFGLAVEKAARSAFLSMWDEGSLTAFRCQFSGNGAGPSILSSSPGAAISFASPLGAPDDLRVQRRILRVFDSRFSDNGNLSGCVTSVDAAGLIRGCLFERNRIEPATSGVGGAISFWRGDNRIERCSFVGNSGYGGAVMGQSGILVIADSTFSGNSSTSKGGAVLADACNLTIDRSTFSKNQAALYGGALYSSSTIALSISHSILAGNSAQSAPDLFIYPNGAFDSHAPNLIGGAPKLAPLAYYGGDLPTMPPLAGSPALDAGTPQPDLPFSDQRGFPRSVGSAPDIGAAEAGPLIVVNTKDDLRGSREGVVSLRDAIAAATELGTRIQFDPNVFTGIGRPGNLILINPSLGSIDLTGKQLAIDATNIPNGIQVDGAGVPLSQPFHALIRADARTTLSMHQVEIRRTRAQAIWVAPSSTLVADRCRLTGNDGQASISQGYPGGTALAVQGRAYLIESRIDSNYTSRFGAAVNVWDEGFVSCQNCLFDENFAELEAGAVYAGTQGGVALDLAGCTFLENESGQLNGGAVYLSGCDLRARHSTFAGNKAGQGNGGAIFLAPGLSAVNSEIIHCTLSANLCGIRGGAMGGVGTMELSNSILAANDAPTDADLGSGLSVVSHGSNLLGGNPMLAPPGDYGGPTPTMPPLPGSPAIDGATKSIETVDQRGFLRDTHFPDIGAVESQRAADLAFFWNLDWDGDGSPFGTEYASGTDALAPDRGDPAHPRLTADASGHPGITFGIDSSVAYDVAWVVRRSTDLTQFEEIYRFDGRSQTETSLPGIISELTPPLSPDRITVIDTNPPSPRAFYQSGAEQLP